MISSTGTAAAAAVTSSRDPQTFEQLIPVVYEELRRLARRYMAQERVDHTLQPTALVHEAFVRLIDQSRVDWKGRAHFFAVAAEIMRHVLVDYARQRKARKRRAAADLVVLTESMGPTEKTPIDVLALNDALDELNRLSERQRMVVDLRYFGGLNVEETAHVLHVSSQTVRLDWRMARAWLKQRLTA